MEAYICIKFTAGLQYRGIRTKPPRTNPPRSKPPQSKFKVGKIRVSSLGDVEGPKEARRLGTLSWANYDTE